MGPDHTARLRELQEARDALRRGETDACERALLLILDHLIDEAEAIERYAHDTRVMTPV
jgi:hypothetical protein